ncbi:Dead end protein like [Schistosoma japonicum]|nr:Dead end protein like [Schistosoma japonicum]
MNIPYNSVSSIERKNCLLPTFLTNTMSSMHQSFHTSQHANRLLNDNVGWSLSREYALFTLSDKTSYRILQENNQGCYGPPPNWYEPKLPQGCEVFIRKIPRDCCEDKLVPIFELVDKIYVFRLMMNCN